MGVCVGVFVFRNIHSPVSKHNSFEVYKAMWRSELTRYGFSSLSSKCLVEYTVTSRITSGVLVPPVKDIYQGFLFFTVISEEQFCSNLEQIKQQQWFL